MKKLIPPAVAALLMLGANLSLAQQPANQQSEGASVTHMNEIMQRIRSVEDPEERAQLLEQHLNEMHAAMAQIHATMGQLMEHVEQQRTESRRLHDHARTKR
jgi:hypothetical protein